MGRNSGKLIELPQFFPNICQFVYKASTGSKQIMPGKSKKKAKFDSNINPKTGKPYKRTLQTRIKISQAHKGKKKLYPTYLVGRRGPAHPAYVHGQGYSRKGNDLEKQHAWRQAVLQKYNFTCFVTGSTENLQAHHLIGWWYELTRFHIPNGVCLCKQIHDEYHLLYTRDKATVESFEAFLNERYPNVTKRPWRDEGYCTELNPWNLGNNQPSPSNATLSAIIQNTAKHADRMLDEFLTIYKRPHHDLKEGIYEHARSVIKIWCNNCQKETETTFTNYKKCKNGTPCCGQKQQILKAQHYERDEKGRFRDSTPDI